MAKSKMDKSAHSPGWGEVIAGAVLSIVLGAALGAVSLMLRPVMQVKEMPKEPAKGAVYVIEGSRDSKKSAQAAAKRKAFVGGQSVTATEDEINSLVHPLPAVAAAPSAKPKGPEKEKEKGPPAKAAPKAAAPAANNPPASDELIALGEPNVRIHDGIVTLLVPVTINLLGLDQHVLVSSDGSFVKREGGFVFESSSLMVGCCPAQRLPLVAGLLTKKFLTAKSVPEDIATAWAKVTDVAIEGNALKLTMP